MEQLYTLNIGGLTKQEAKDMVEDLYGSVMWSYQDDILVSWPSKSKATISPIYPDKPNRKDDYTSNCCEAWPDCTCEWE